jgi:multimeric flavodoxin WrbA
MNLLCISASNIEPFRAQSASTRACRLAADLAAGRRPGLQTEVLALIDYELTPCRMCAACLGSGLCCRDEAFNQVNARMQAADAVLMVVPHYAPFPSKVMMLLEKLQEMAFLNYCRDNTYRAPLAGKPLAVVGHGGQTEEAVPYFLKAIVEPLANAFDGVGMRVIGSGADSPRGAAFGIHSLRMPEAGVFCEIEHDWDGVRRRLQPLVSNLIEAI